MPTKPPADPRKPLDTRGKLLLKNGIDPFKYANFDKRVDRIDRDVVVNSTIPNPKILKTTARLSRDLTLDCARPGEPELYVYGYTAVRPQVIAADDSGEYLVLDLLWSAGEIGGLETSGGQPYIYMPDIGVQSVPSGSPLLHEHFTGTSGQSASTIMTALKGSYAAYPNKAHSVISMQDGWNLNIMAVVFGRKVKDPRVSPMVRAYSQNAALCLADILDACGYSLDWDSVAAAADYCDEEIDSPSIVPRWTVGGVIRDRHSLQYWVHTMAQCANCFVDEQGGNVILTPDKPRAANHTVTAADMVEGTVRVNRKSSRDVPDSVTVSFQAYLGRSFSYTYGTPGGSGKNTQLDMPMFWTFSSAARKAEETYRKAQLDLSLEYVGFDDGLIRTIGDVGTITNADYGLNSQAMILVENEPVDRGRWRRRYIEYDATAYVDTYGGDPTTNDTTLYNPYRPPDGPTPTLTAELVTSTSPNYYRIKIDFSPTTWAYLKDYKVNVYIDGAPGTILHSEYVAKGSETGSPETITVYADLNDSPGFQMNIGTSPQTVYRVDVYNRSQWLTQEGDEVLSATPGTATVTDPGDPNILWTTDPITVYRIGPDAASNIYATLEFVYFIADYTYGGTPALPWLVYEPAFGTLPTAANQYLFKVDLISTDSGTANLEINFTTGLEGSWLDFYTYHNADGGVFIDLGDTTANSTAEHKVIDVAIAQDDGGGSPVAGTAVTKRINIISYKGSGEFIVYDNFTGTNGTNLAAHAPDTNTISPNAWTALSGTFEIQSNEAESISGAASYTIDAGAASFEVAAEVSFNGVSGGLLGRVQDSSNYWELNVTNPSTSDPVLNLVKVVAGSPITVATKTLTGAGSLGATPIQMRLKFDGNVITGALNKYWTAMDGPSEVTYTDTAFNTETACGITAAGAGVEFNRLSISDLEITLLP